jgi:hypothetical protein
VWEVSVTTSRFHPAPGERSFQTGSTTQVLHKDDLEVADFLSRLALVHKVFELGGRDHPFPFLHPYSYGFGFKDSEGVSHIFKYRVEAGRHQDDTYRGFGRGVRAVLRGQADSTQSLRGRAQTGG